MTADQPADGSTVAIRRLREKLVYRTRLADVYDDQVVFADGREGTYLRIVELAGRPGVAMLAVCGHDIALVRTYRYPLTSWEWAIPRGYAHYDDASMSAQAELVEEIGQEPDDLVPIGVITPNSGLLASRVQLFYARYATAVSKPIDREEVADTKWIGIKQLYGEIAHGQIADAFTLAALTCAQAYGLVQII